jgi:hypothetical protein
MKSSVVEVFDMVNMGENWLKSLSLKVENEKLVFVDPYNPERKYVIELIQAPLNFGMTPEDLAIVLGKLDDVLLTKLVEKEKEKRVSKK